MGRKDADRFLKLEKAVETIEDNIAGLITAQQRILKLHQDAMVQMRDLLTKLIEGR